MDMHTQQEKASILLIYTGGTIGMIENPETGVLESFNFQHLKDNMPELKKLGYSVATIQFDPPMDSSEMGPDSWMKIVKIIADNYQKYDGFVVLHGTDTMSYTASALSFMLENLSKPVILTGSQLPIGMLRTDGKEKLFSEEEFPFSPVASCSTNTVRPEAMVLTAVPERLFPAIRIMHMLTVSDLVIAQPHSSGLKMEM